MWIKDNVFCIDDLMYVYLFHSYAFLLDRVAQSVKCLTADLVRLTADPGVASFIPARFHTFVEIDHEIICTVILHPSPDSKRVVISYK